MRFIERFLLGAAVSASIVLVFDVSGGAQACSPWFPNQVISDRGEQLQSLPALQFDREMARIPKPDIPESKLPPKFDALTDVEDVRDVEAALRARGDAADSRRRTVAALRVWRANLREVAERQERRDWERRLKYPVTVAQQTAPTPPAGLPAAFDLYLRGAAAWAVGDVAAARTAWRAVVALPPDERRPRAVWAEYMLGRSLVDEKPAEAIAWFTSLRELVRNGAPDPLGLASAAVGWEARARYRSREFVRALTLYQAQGDSSSVLTVLRTAFTRPEWVQDVAADPLTRRLGTVYVVTRGGPRGCDELDPESDIVRTWLGAIESVAAQSVADADRLAWISYAAGDFDGARRWLARTTTRSPLVPWVEAKLLLREGRLQEASGRLAEAARGFPSDEEWGDVQYDGDDDKYGISPALRLLAENGAVELRRGDFVASLDLLVKAGDWLDAAFVAERVLTVDELREFVAARHPRAEGSPSVSVWEPSDTISSAALHYLLARRLARAGRWADAMPHYPEGIRAKAQTYVAELAAGRDAARARDARTSSLMAAARALRQDGIDLIGTETAPDWAAVGGSFELGDDAPDAVPPEIAARAAAAAVTPMKRWHYRYLAMDLAWEAAALMPDEDVATAAWLREAGCWVAWHDPKGADRFYKALIRRCGTTALGREALAKKWFPRETK
ncbi:MAG: hypothetical protein K8T90_11605 [Planctomycetes bacterium]|nr:hypothetical protein [Planctomycetota bacterium]